MTKKKKIRKYFGEYSGENPFEKALEEIGFQKGISWDWHFEKNAFIVKEQTMKEFDDLLTVIVENRNKMEYVISVSSIDYPNLGAKINPHLNSFNLCLEG